MPGPSQIYFIRHAEKPDDTDDGVTAAGAPDKRSLTPLGWQRAGALAVLFGRPLSPVAKPGVIYAASATTPKASQRPLETITPLAALLRVQILSGYDKGDVSGMVEDVLGKDGQTVLVAWEHKTLAAGLTAANALRDRTTNPGAIPTTWPDDRFDVIWAFARQGDDRYVFSEIPQLVLAGDLATGF